jgi:hypothetical protein
LSSNKAILKQQLGLNFDDVAMKLTQKITTILFVIIIIGCVPTITSIFKAPQVTGKVIDLNTLEPVPGVTVRHDNSASKVVMTDENGAFFLPSISDTEFKLLMPGHAFKRHLVNFENKNNRVVLVAQATLNSRYEELVDFEIVIFDAEPEVISTPFKDAYLDDEVLRASFNSGGILETCDHSMAISAISSLNTSRKLADKARNKRKPNEFAASNYKEWATRSYERSSELWSELRYTCERNLENYQDIDSIFDAIHHEAYDKSF